MIDSGGISKCIYGLGVRLENGVYAINPALHPMDKLDAERLGIRMKEDDEVPADCLNCHGGKFSIDYAPEDDDYPWKCECGRKWKESAILDKELTETKVTSLVWYWDADGEVDASTSCNAGEAMCSFIAKKCNEEGNYSIEFIKKLAKEVFGDEYEEETEDED